MEKLVKRYRALFETEIRRHPSRLKVFLWCLTEALYELATRCGIELQSGRFITTTREGSRPCQMKRFAFMYHFCHFLVWNKIGTEIGTDIGTEIGTHRTLVTAINWDTYRNDAPHVGAEIGTLFGALHFRKLERHWNKGNYILKKRRNKEHALSIASSVKSGENTCIDAVYPVLFEQWYAVYPNKKEKAAVYESRSRLRPTPELAERMIAAVHAQTEWCENAGDEFRPQRKRPAAAFCAVGSPRWGFGLWAGVAFPRFKPGANTGRPVGASDCGLASFFPRFKPGANTGRPVGALDCGASSLSPRLKPGVAETSQTRIPHVNVGAMLRSILRLRRTGRRDFSLHAHGE